MGLAEGLREVLVRGLAHRLVEGSVIGLMRRLMEGLMEGSVEGCIINEYAECRVMVNYGAKAGAWLWWCEGDRTGKSVNDMSMIGMMC